MRIRVMTNPAQLLLAGNPGKKRSKRKVTVIAAKAPTIKEPAVAKRRKKSKASRVARVAKRRAKRASRRKAMPAGLKKYWAKRRGKAAAATPKRRRARRSRKSRLKVKRAKSTKRRSRRRSRARRAHVKNVVASAGTRVIVRKVRRGKVRSARRRSGRKVGTVGVNAGTLSLTGGLTHFLANAKATAKDGVKGFAFALAGAGVSVAGGAFTSQVTSNIIGRFAPSLLSNPVVARLLGAVNYYLPGWAAAKYVPGLSGKSRRAMLTGAAAAAIVEIVRPGSVRGVLSQIPVVGGLLAGVEDSASDLGAYVGYALNGEGGGEGYGGVYDANPGAGSGHQPDGTPIIGMDGYVSLNDYVALNDYHQVDSDAVQNILR